MKGREANNFTESEKLIGTCFWNLTLYLLSGFLKLISAT